MMVFDNANSRARYLYFVNCWSSLSFSFLNLLPDSILDESKKSDSQFKQRMQSTTTIHHPVEPRNRNRTRPSSRATIDRRPRPPTSASAAAILRRTSCRFISCAASASRRRAVLRFCSPTTASSTWRRRSSATISSSASSPMSAVSSGSKMPASASNWFDGFYLTRCVFVVFVEFKDVLRLRMTYLGHPVCTWSTWCVLSYRSIR